MSNTVFHLYNFIVHLSLLIDHSLSTEAATSSSTKMTLHSLVKELIFRDSEVIKQVFLHFYNQIWQSPLSLVEISFTILCQPPGKEALYSERHSISFERITQPFLISGDQSFLLSASSDHCQCKRNFLNSEHTEFLVSLTYITVSLFSSVAEGYSYRRNDKQQKS